MKVIHSDQFVNVHDGGELLTCIYMSNDDIFNFDIFLTHSHKIYQVYVNPA